MKLKTAVVLSFLLALTPISPARAGSLTAFPLDEAPVPLFERPKRGTKAIEVRLSREGTELTDERRIGDDRWYAATVGGRTGWLFGGAVYVLGPADEADEEKLDPLFERYTNAVAEMAEGKGPDDNWIRRPNVRYEGDADNYPATIVTLASREAVIQTMNGDDRILHLYLAVNTPTAAEHFLGFPAVGMTEEHILDKLGPETERRGNTLIWSLGGGESNFSFTIAEGKVALAEYSLLPGNGVVLPDRVFELQRFRDVPPANWPRVGWSKGNGVRIRAMPSTQAKIVEQLKETETGLVWHQRMDRGEAYPWYFVTIGSGPQASKGWIYGQFITPQEDRNNAYWSYFWDSTQHGLWGGMDDVKKRLGKPRKPNEWTEEWPGLTLRYQELDDQGIKERYLASIKIADPEIDIGDIRVGDPVESLDELVSALLDNHWSGEKELQEGENSFLDPEGLNSITLKIEKGALASFTWDYNAN